MQKFGLSKVEVERNREEYGKNVLPKKKEKSFLRSYLSAFDDPIIKILLVALAISIFFAFTGGEIFETLGILSSILLATTVATISERGGQSAFKKLKKEAEEIKCRVLREGTITILPISEVVTNDIVLLEAGEKVPADGVIIDGECLVNQAALNGETKEATKTVGARPETSPSQSGRSQVRPLHTAHEVQVDFLSPSHVFMGTVVTSGVAKMRVTAVGKNTEYGRLAMELVDDLRESPLRHRLTKLAIILSRIGYGVAVFVGLSYLFNIFFLSSGFSWDLAYIVRHVFYALTLSVSIVVIAVPEGLPMMISVVLSSNMKKMLKDKILVRKLVSIETMGSLNMLFFDKTGTITKGKLEAKKFVTLDENDENSPFLRARLLRNCVYNNSSSLVEEDGKAKIFGGNSTDRALLAYALNSEKVVGLDVETEVISKTEFNSTDKFSSITIKQNGEVITYLKGSPEKLLPCCDIGLEEKKEFEERLKNYAKQGFRILLFCENSELIGAILLKDEMRDEASLTIESLKKAGIQPVMLTGDAKETAVSIATECGLLEGNKNVVLTSKELNLLTDDEVKKVLPKLCVVARALPSDKSRLVRLNQELNLVVGMTGDGINDAPALKKADVGLAMGSGTEIAKEAGDIVILDDNLASILKGVLYGRTIFKNIRKFVMFQLSINFTACFLSILSPFIGIGTPITILQILWINLIIDTFAGIAFSREPALAEYLLEPPKKRTEPIINRFMWLKICSSALFILSIALMFFKLPILSESFNRLTGALPLLTAFFCFLVFSSVLNSFDVRTTSINPFKNIRHNKRFLLIMCLVVVTQLMLCFFFGTIFRAVPPTAKELMLVVSLALLIVPFNIIRKLLFKKFRVNTAF